MWKKILQVFIFNFLLVNVSSAGKVEEILTRISNDSTYYELRLTSDQKADFLSGVNAIVENAYSERNDPSDERDFSGYYPSDLYDIYFENVEALFLGGYTTQDPVNSWISDYKGLLNTNIDTEASVEDTDSDEEKDQKRFNYIRTKLVDIHRDFLTRVDATNLGCASEGQVTGNKKCCADHVKLRSEVEALASNNSCKTKGTTCSTHGDCCSGMCNKDSADGTGVCEPQTYCSAVRYVGETCSSENYICKSSTCISLDASELSVEQTCKKAGKSCSSSSDCCSGSCSGGQCQEVMNCLSCKKDGATVSDGESCCPGYIKQNGKCMAPFPVFVPTVFVPKDNQNIFEKFGQIIFTNIFWSSAFADTEEDRIEALIEEQSASTEESTTEDDTDVREEYFEEYNIPGITSKTYSNVKTCEFNSFNDSWRDASNKEKNAEIFLRSFEYVFSHKGTEDYWVDGDNGNVFSRANAVATKFRENRTELLKNMQEMDITMTCKCMAVYGMSEFSELKVSWFNSNCPDEVAILNTKSASNSEDADDESVTDDVSDLATVDENALGTSLEKLIIEWLEMRADAQVARYEDNSELEEELTALSEFISGTDFDEVYKDRALENAIGSTEHYVEASPSGDTILLYKWGYKYRPGWMRIFNFLTLGLLEAIFTNSLFDFDKGKASSGTASVTHSMQAAWRYSEVDEIDSTPEIADVKTMKKECVRKILVCVQYADGFHRYYVGPRYENENDSSSTKCSIPARASSCFKSAYRVDIDEEVSYIMDPTLPLFIDESLIDIDSMPGYSETFTTMIKDAKSSGITYLKSLKPGNLIRTTSYYNGGDDFGNTNHLALAIAAGHFVPKSGNLNVAFAEDADSSGISIKSAIIAGAKKYALCKSLKDDCGATSISNAELVGYGYLFEDETEAASFAEYTYDIHWKWSHLSKNSYMGYPLQGMDQYFQLASYSMQLVGSAALQRAMNYKEAADLYTADFNAREGDYSANGTAEAGEDDDDSSTDSEYSSSFYQTLSNLSFSGVSNLEVFDEAVSDGTKSGSLSSGELATLASARSSAAVRNDAISAAESLESAAASSDTTSQSALASNSASLSEMSNPLNSFTLQKLGNSSVSTTGTSSTASSDSSGSSSKDKNDKSSSKKATSANGFDMSEYLKGLSSKAASSYGSSSSRGYGNSGNSRSSTNSSSTNSGLNNSANDSGLNGGEINSLLDGLGRKNLDPNSGDSIFSIVSKAYKRNYGRVLTRVEDAVEPVREETTLKSGEESELKTLLGE